jgi:hypothetical protein
VTLKLRRGAVVSEEPLTVDVDGERRPAWADPATVGEVREGDEVVVNTEAVDLALGSGGFDVVHVNLTRGLDAPGADGAHVMKLNYTSLQHPVEPVEPELDGDHAPARAIPVLVFHLHGQLPPILWAAAREGLRIGYVQTPGGALPGALSSDVVELGERELLAGHVTAGPGHACVAGPGPGILGSASRLGHGGLAALDTLHTALALGMPTLLAPRLSSSDPRGRHRGLSHHSRTVLEMVLAPVRVPVPEIETEGWPLLGAEAPEGGSGQEALEELIAVTKGRHDLVVERVDLGGYAASGLPASTMGRDLDEDPLFFAAALAAGAALAAAAAR